MNNQHLCLFVPQCQDATKMMCLTRYPIGSIIMQTMCSQCGNNLSHVISLMRDDSIFMPLLNLENVQSRAFVYFMTKTIE